MTPQQCRAARALLDWSQADLARRSKVAVRTVQNFEKGAHETMQAKLDAMQSTLQVAGVQFSNGDQLGVKLVKRKGKG